MARRHHDLGGLPAGQVDRTEHALADWEVLADAVNQALSEKGIRRTDELRRALEEMNSELYRALSYYERWIVGVETILTEKKILTREEIDRKMAEFEAKWGQP